MIPEGAIYPLKVLWETTEEILSDAQHVIVTDMPYEPVVKGLIEFEQNFHGTPYPKGVQDKEELVLYYLIRDSVNYCYWYGRPSVRPNGSNSGKVAELLSEVFETTGRGPFFIENVIYLFGQKLKEERFPMVTERLECLAELVDNKNRGHALNRILISPQYVLEQMIEVYPRYTSDMFLKRASLFIGELYKGSQWTQGKESHWAEDIYAFPVPADYHLPNILRNLSLIAYKPQLAMMVDQNVILPKGSEEEVEIRAATVHVCQTLSYLAKVPAPIVDEFLFSKRHDALQDHPFHLTITTDY